MKIEMLNLRQTRVSSLSPLAGMPIRRIDATSIPALDYVFFARGTTRANRDSKLSFE